MHVLVLQEEGYTVHLISHRAIEILNVENERICSHFLSITEKNCIHCK